MAGKHWSARAITALRRRYPHEPTAAIAADLGVSVTACYQKAGLMGIKKSAVYLASPAAGRLQRDENVGAASRYLPGHVPANKGIKGWQAGGRARETQFKTGRAPHNAVPIGSYRFEPGTGTLQRKISAAKGNNSMRWRGVHELVWVAAHGPVPDGHLCVFRPGMRTTDLADITLERVDCISFAENMRRNSYHTRYPKDIGLAIQARGALVRKIRNAERDTPSIHTTQESTA